MIGTYLVQIPNNLIQRRCKRTIHIQKHALLILALQLPPQIPHHLLKPPLGANLAHVLREGRRPDRLELDHHLVLRKSPRAGERRGRVPREVGEDDGRGHGER